MKHKATIAIALCTIAAMPTLSQTIPYAEFVNADTTVCDVISLNIPVRCKVNGTEMFSLRYNCPSQGDKLDRNLTLEEGNDIYYIPINIDDNGSAVWSQDHTETIRLISISTESGGEVALDKTFDIRLFTTPKTRLASERTGCGRQMEMTIDDGRPCFDAATFQWSAAGAAIEASAPGRAVLTAPGAGTYDVTLTETVGGKCRTTISEQLTLLGSPIGHIDGSAIICSNIEDPNFDFEATIRIEGNEPFYYRLSNGFGQSGLPAGESVIGLNARQQSAIVIDTIADANGCAATPADLTGQVTVTDRKPNPAVAQDTVAFTGVTTISVDMSDPAANDVLWTLGPDTPDNGIIADPTSARTQYRSVLYGIAQLIVTETNSDGLECADSDTLYLMSQMPLRYPNGISPNGDGINDCLVIEGLPNSNTLTVFDTTGSIVFQTRDYRNDWGGTDNGGRPLEEGYYYYVLEGTDISTIKETLVIKRN